MSETSASNAVPEPPEAPKPPVPPVPPGPPEPVKISDPEVLRALAHPARLAVWDFLGICQLEGRDGATATEVAEAANMTPSAMSYHLRTLAKAGFIEEAPNRGDARERVWRVALTSFSMKADRDAPESTKLAEAAAAQAIAARTDEHFARWSAAKFKVDPETREASMFTQSRLRLTVEEAAELQKKVHELLEPYARRTFERMQPDAFHETEEATEVWNFTARLFPNL